jgi:hypothetical protein
MALDSYFTASAAADPQLALVGTLLAVITGDPWFPVKRRHTAFSQVLTKKGRDVLRMDARRNKWACTSFTHPPPLHIHTHVRVGARATPNSHVAKARCGVLLFWSRP